LNPKTRDASSNDSLGLGDDVIPIYVGQAVLKLNSGFFDREA